MDRVTASEKSPSRSCPNCGAEIPAGVAHCTPCLLAVALGPTGGEVIPLAKAATFRFGEYEIAPDAPQLEGGMGVVYRARQANLNRTVALKAIKGGILIRPEQVARFRAEAEAAASLDHPNIVPIYEIGEHQGRQFFTMKWLDGGSLAGSAPNSRGQILKTPQAAALLVATVARAVHHAHQRGFIHRDLKPSNILLDTAGNPHVSDFGLAKRFSFDLDTPPITQLTSSGDIFGTPGYMAPEQAAGKATEVTTIADVYSLGAILYELLAGQPPFVGDTPAATMHKLLTEEPPRPSLLNPKIPRDLEIVCLKCLEKEPRLRYGSAESLADDLDRWLRGEPILARAVGPWARACKWARRKPAEAALAAALVFVGIAGVGGTFYQFGRAQRASQEIARNQATLSQAGSAMQTLLKLADDEGLQEPEFDSLRKGFLETILPFLRNLADRGGADQTSASGQAALKRDFGALFQQLGDFAQAETNFLQTLAIERQLLAARPSETNYQRELASTYSTYAWFLSEAHRGPEAVAAARAAFQISEKLSAAYPGERSFRGDLTRISQMLGAVLTRHADKKEAEETYLNAIKVGTPLVADGSASPEDRYWLAMSYANLGNLVSNQQRPAETEIYWNKALGMFEKLSADFPAAVSYRQKLAIIHGRLGRLFADTARWSQADQSFEISLGQLGGLATNYPLRVSFQHAFAEELQNVGSRWVNAGRTNEGLALLQNAVSVETKVVQLFPGIAKHRYALASYYQTIGNVLEDNGEALNAERADTNFLGLMSQLVADFPGHPVFPSELAVACSQLGELLASQPDRLAEAETELKRAVGIREELSRSPSADASLRHRLAVNYADLGGVYLRAGRLPEAEEILRQAAAIAEELVLKQPRTQEFRSGLAETCGQLAAALSARGQKEESLLTLRKTLALWKELALDFPTNTTYRQQAEQTRLKIGASTP